MKIEKVNINDLISPSYNPRDMPPEEMEKLKTSIQEFGYVDPIIVNDVNMHIVGGNQRYEAMKELNFTEVEVSYVHIEDMNREKALNIMLNKVSGDWDFEKLGEIFEEMKIEGFDFNLTGFNDYEIDLYLPNNDLDFTNPFDYDDEDEEEPEDYVEIQGDNSNESYVVYISFDTQEEANEYLKTINAPYTMSQNSVKIHCSETSILNKEE